ncbi:uncharacterized protein L969DRAFT_45279 [Mixia osmundae IAM 14324]|uniref:Uncharacterized protein n=1 Tax=Mixia osmundae (strain CBS 9802 / IAM 14324 / JCM 22182 / KY 12970) TaxID=764103 RepID=G7DYU0_MIXOS|nr:uncharacterized protein L969DRAFT_45279 [Mixia osmundae IAM 14324]KEI41646.1 hypothetical protein L969DRAFT_45279 [Mixia osmundae IAM 14324]GAA95750.1 hypothetical protein E5Q_02407 [Mixia osmundae IAM 14324]
MHPAPSVLLKFRIEWKDAEGSWPMYTVLRHMSNQTAALISACTSTTHESLGMPLQARAASNTIRMSADRAGNHLHPLSSDFTRGSIPSTAPTESFRTWLEACPEQDMRAVSLLTDLLDRGNAIILQRLHLDLAVRSSFYAGITYPETDCEERCRFPNGTGSGQFSPCSARVVVVAPRYEQAMLVRARSVAIMNTIWQGPEGSRRLSGI